ncbi:RAMP superfamily CRISPR-associated protein [Fusobacterium polymorphum]|uniref:RAMP superfamily CRISPR-associated protein n=1 Tax=Fusobacterium nucleatum subsp. polymorphum TaxID=76857 RepID=UPI0030D4B4E4
MEEICEKKFLKLDNKLVIKLEIIPLSPLTIKYSPNERKKEEVEDESDVYTGLLTTEKGKKLKSKKGIIEDKDEVRKGEIYIPGSTLKGLFRDRFLTIFGEDTKYVNDLFGVSEGKDTKKSKFFIQDAFLLNEKLRELFYTDVKKALKETISSRAITPIDHFSSKAKVPLQYEYTMENFETELVINNATLKDLKGIYFLIRDSINNEIRIGNSKSRGFGLIKFKIKDFKYEQFKSTKDELKKIEEYFYINDKESKKIGNKYISKTLYLKDDFRDIDVENPNKLIVALFEKGVN